MRQYFEPASCTLIELDTYNRDHISPSGPVRQASISGVDFSGGRGSSGVDLLWNHPQEFMELSKYQKDELVDWIHSNTGKKLIKSSGKAAQTNKSKGLGIGKEGDKKPEGG